MEDGPAGSSEEEGDSSDEAADVVNDKKPGAETCDEDSDDLEDTAATIDSSQAGVRLPLARASYASRRSYSCMETPTSQSSQ